MGEEVWPVHRRVVDHMSATMMAVADDFALADQTLEHRSLAATGRELWSAEAVRPARHCSASGAVEASLLQAAMGAEAGPGCCCILHPK